MASKNYLVRFGADNPANKTGLTPTFTKFLNSAGGATTPPSIAEIASSGLYGFSYDPQGFIAFLLDGGAALSATDRYVAGVLDLNDRISEVGATLTALGSTQTAIGATLIATGATLVAFGGTQTAQGTALGTLAVGTSMTAIGVGVFATGVTLVAQGSTLVGFGSTQTAQGTAIGGLAVGTSMTAIGAALASKAEGATLSHVYAGLLTVNANIAAQGQSLFASMDVLGATQTAQGVILAGLGSGTTLIGTAADSFGTAGADPTSLFGYLKRLQELLEGDSTYTKTTAVWAMYSRGSAVALRSKTISDGATTISKS